MYISKVIFIITALVCSAILIGCGGEAAKPNTNTNNSVNSGKTNTNSNVNQFGTTNTVVGEKTNDAAAIAPVILAYYEALKKKDDAALRKIYSAAAIRELEAGMKTDGKKSIADYITSSEPVGDKPFEVRNEKIEGETAVAEIRGGSYGTWVKWKFLKEDGAWKKAPPSEDFKLLGK